MLKEKRVCEHCGYFASDTWSYKPLTWRPEFKSCMRLFAFHIVLKPLGKGMNPTIIVGQTEIFNLGMAIFFFYCHWLEYVFRIRWSVYNYVCVDLIFRSKTYASVSVISILFLDLIQDLFLSILFLKGKAP